MNKITIIFLMFIMLIQIVNAQEYQDSDWSSYKEIYLDYIKSNISEVKNYVEWKSSDFEWDVMNITGSYGFRDFVCYPKNETIYFDSRVFDCEWTSEPKPIIWYEESMYWTNLTKEKVECGFLCKTLRLFNFIFKELVEG